MSVSGKGIFDQVEEAIRASKEAFQRFSYFSVREREDLVTKLRVVMLRHVEELAIMEQEETGMGVAADKAVQITRAILGTPGPEKIRRETESDEEGLFLEESFAYGVSCAAHPVNHPAASIINCTIMLLSAGNSVIHLLPKRAEKVSCYTVRLLNSYISDICGIGNLSVCMDESRYEYNKIFMEHPDTSLVVVTGGDDMVRSAMSLKKRVIAAGAANPVVIVDEIYDMARAASQIMEDITFDNNLLCTSEKCAVVLSSVIQELGMALVNRGAYWLDAKQSDMLMRTVFDDDLCIRKEYVGKSAAELLAAAGIFAGNLGDFKALFFETEVISPFVLQEFAAPVLPIVRADTFEEALELAKFIEQDRNHTAGVFSNDVNHLSAASRAMRTSVFVKNGSTLYAAGIKGSASVSFTIANVTGEGPVIPSHLIKRRKCMLINAFDQNRR